MAFVCLASALLVVVNVAGVRDRWARTGRISVFLAGRRHACSTLPRIQKALHGTDGVQSVRYVSSEEARREVTGDNADKVLAALPAEAFPASLEVSVDEHTPARQIDRIAAQLDKLPAVDTVETYKAWSDRLGTLLAGGVSAAGLLALVVLGAVISVVSSTIRLTLQRRRIEVEVLKLVGATDGYVRRPFVLEGAAQGAIGAALAIGLLGVLYAIVQSHFDAQLGTLLGMRPTFLPWSVSLLMVLTGAALGAAAAYASLRRLLVV